ncbi:hypothetical protein HPB50_000961 [Hyalomma asiaticum]|uniref:Uncharacterized protein n=1 Tax=Hyalomma asiaticum TaxID=266040 RepID=A0ACB7S762_HYAAI|nr:hypothetical protein HPB50_000961 [Hyalomma asiaticum]
MSVLDIGASVMLMMTKFGQEYQCSLPENSYPTEHAESDDAEAEAQDVLKLLEPLRNAPCLTKEQFNKTGQQKYHSQVYSHGSKCDITGVPRKAEVRYFCDEESTDYIDSVEEPETCSYVFTVHTSRVCAFPPLKRISPSKPHTISCSPRLTEKQYQKYLEVKENEKKLEEEKRKLWLLEQQKNLEAIKSFVKKEPSNGIASLEKPVVDIEEEQGIGAVAKRGQDAGPGSHASAAGFSSASSEDNHRNQRNVRPQVPADMQNDETPVLENTRNDVAKQFKEVFSKKGEGDLHDEATAQFNDDSQADMNVVLERLMKRLKQMEADAEADAEESAKGASQQNVAEGQQNSGHLGEPADAAKIRLVVKRLWKKNTMKRTPVNWSAETVIKTEAKKEVSSKIEVAVHAFINYEDNSGYPGEGGQADSDANKQGEDGHLESQTDVEPEEVGSLRVRIRRYGQQKPKEPGKKVAKYQELDLPSEDKSKLETALRDRLQKAGVTAGGRKIEVKIITAGYYDDEEAKGLNVLSPEETRQFQNMIVTLLMGNQEAAQEIEKHQRLEKNYNFVWNIEETSEDPPASASEDEEER